jgi:hypothetical protein
MRDLDSYQVFCALELLRSKEEQYKPQDDSYKKEQEEILCACTKYLEE